MDNAVWFGHYDAGVPRTLAPYPRETLVDLVRAHARHRPQAPAVLFKGAQLSWQALDQLSDCFAAWLQHQGVRKGDRVAAVLPNCPQFLIAQYGAWKAGAIFAPLSPLSTSEELRAVLQSNGAETIVVLTPFYSRVKRIQPETALRRVVATNIKEYLPPVLRLLFTILKEQREGHRVRLHPEDYTLPAVLAAGAALPPPTTPPDPDDPAVLLCTGGTTGVPKSALGLHRALCISARQLKAWFGEVLEDWKDVFLLPLPLFHVYGMAGVQSAAVVGGHPLALVPNPRDLDDLVATIARVRPALFSGVPTLYLALLNHPRVARGAVDFRQIKVCICGAAPLLAETQRAFERLAGKPIVEGYSLTEAMMACLVNPVRGRCKAGSIGLPLPDVEARIVDLDQGEQILPPGKVGELILRAPQVMVGYWNNPAETAAVLRSHGEGDPWLHTGDLATMDDEGYFFILDRKKDLIKVSGNQVWPREIEEVIATHPAILEVGVKGIPHPQKGEAPKAWVVLRAGATATPDEIRDYVRARLAPYKVPVEVEIRRELPKSLIGKVLRRELVAEAGAPAEAPQPAETPR
ncbi:MAG: AMP-dependent synthetase [Dehalococcoidia bacterium]|nr:MAG: AMP-dependent synthetase [Dehalococcoidia bacterium]